MSASAYDRTCEQSRDCVPIFEGDVKDCSVPRDCPNAAINVRDHADYYSDFSTRATFCQNNVSQGCSIGVVACPTGQCEFHPLSEVDGGAGAALAVSPADYEQTCTEVADCVPVYLGPLGCCGTCPNAAINAAAKPQHESDVAHRTPICSPPICGRPAACANGRIACQGGRCALLFAPDGGTD